MYNSINVTSRPGPAGESRLDNSATTLTALNKSTQASSASLIRQLIDGELKES